MKTGQNLNQVIKYVALGSSVMLLVSCAATQTAIEHRNLETSAKLSKTIFLDPVPQSQRSIYIAVKNTSEEKIDIHKELTKSLSQQGYRVVANPAEAHYLLQANVLKVGKMSRTASENALGGGYGSALAGAGTGVALGALNGYNNTTLLAGGITGGLVGLAADSLVKAVNYTMITDVQISERVGRGDKVHEIFNSGLENGTASSTFQTASKESQFMRYRTRVVSNADKVNLSFSQAKPNLERGLVKVITGIF